MPAQPRISLFIALLVTAVPVLRGQDLITNISVNTTTPPPSAYTSADTGPLTYENAVEALAGFTTSTGTYTVSGTADNSLVQRNGTNYQSSVWYDQGTGSDLKGVHQDTYGAMLKSNNFYEGSDNTFANGTGAQTGNIERLDFTWTNSFSSLSTLAFAVFDRGAVGVHDGFTIALVTGIDAGGKPTAYGGALKVAGNWGGASNPGASLAYNLLRYTTNASAPDATTAAITTNETNTQGVGGLVIPVSLFGTLPAGTHVYGYSLMGYDVDISNLNNLVDTTNTAVYPANTDPGTGAGGIDLAAVNGLEIREVPVPEPTACALVTLLTGGGLLMLAAARRNGPGA